MSTDLASSAVSQTAVCFKGLNKFPNIIRYIFNVWRKIIDDLNAHVIYSPLVYSKISCGGIKIIKLYSSLRSFGKKKASKSASIQKDT